MAKDAENPTYGAIPNIDDTEDAPLVERGPLAMPDMKSIFFAELFGTCTFVQLGLAVNCVSLFASASAPVAAVWGGALALGIYLSANYSGGHLNPAVSLAFALVRPENFSLTRLVPYCVAQLLGSMLAACINLFIFHRLIKKFETKHQISPGFDLTGIQSAAAFGDYYGLNPDEVTNGYRAFIVEAFGTAVLVFVIFTSTNNKSALPGVAVPAIVGFTLWLLASTLGPLTGASFNPARDLGPRLVTSLSRWGFSAMNNFVPYLLGPLVGGPIGAFMADKVLMA